MAGNAALILKFLKVFFKQYYRNRQSTVSQSADGVARQKRAETIIAAAPPHFYTRVNLLVVTLILVIWLSGLFASVHVLTYLNTPDLLLIYAVFAVLFGLIGPAVLIAQYTVIWTFKALGKSLDRDALLVSYGHINQAYYDGEIPEKKRIIFDDDHVRNHQIAQIASILLLLSAFLPALYFALLK